MVKTKSKLKRCNNGFRRNKKTGNCENIKHQSQKRKRCKNGTRRDKKTGNCYFIPHSPDGPPPWYLQK